MTPGRLSPRTSVEAVRPAQKVLTGRADTRVAPQTSADYRRVLESAARRRGATAASSETASAMRWPVRARREVSTTTNDEDGTHLSLIALRLLHSARLILGIDKKLDAVDSLDVNEWPNITFTPGSEGYLAVQRNGFDWPLHAAHRRLHRTGRIHRLHPGGHAILPSVHGA